MTITVNDPGNHTGYALNCPTCGDPRARSLPTIVHEAGDVYSLVTYTHTVNCPTCDGGQP